jgi:hypothetical protein
VEAAATTPERTPDPTRETAKSLLKVGYGLGIPGTVLSPWIIKRRSVPLFAALLTGSALITTGWGLLRRWPTFGVNLAGFFGFLLWWRRAGS